MGNLGEILGAIPSEIYVFLISMLPIAELRGAIPVGAAMGIPFYVNFPLALIGNMLPVPFILIFIPRLLGFLGRFRLFAPITEWLKRKAYKNKDKIIKKSAEADEIIDEGENRSDTQVKKQGFSAGVFWALMLFVALPIPGTGAWTGALVASVFDLPKKTSFAAIFIGVAICGVIMCLAAYGAVEFLKFLL